MGVKRGFGGRNPQLLEDNMGSEAEPLERCGNFTAFFFFKYAFLGKCCPKFLLKNSFFKCLNKVLMCLQGLRPEVHAPTCPSSCTSEHDHSEFLKHTAKGVGRKFSRGGVNGKNKTKK